MNKSIYGWTIVLSILFILPACFNNDPVFTILSSIGCSGLAAAIMAIFLEDASIKKENEKKAKARAIYFRELNDQLKMMLERILWFDARMNEDFDWDKDPASYSTFHFMLYASQQYPKEEVILFQEAEKRLQGLEQKYNLEQQAKMTPEQLLKTQKMFLILSASGLSLLSEINSIRGSRVELHAEDYISLKEIENLSFQIPLGISLMCKPNKNYGAAISSLLSAYKTIRNIGNFSDKIHIGLHGTIKMNEL